MTDVDPLVAQHRHLVAEHVDRVLARVPSHVDRHDLRDAAVRALVESAGSFRPRPGLAFADHASAAIRLALRDLLRALPLRPLPSGRDLTHRLGLLEAAIADLPEPERHVVTSYFLRARPLLTVAREQGSTVETVQEVVATALLILRDALNAGLVPQDPRGSS